MKENDINMLSSKLVSAAVLVFILSFQGCLENNTIPALIFPARNSAEMLGYFESEGDFINSPEAPALVTAENVYNNLSSYLIIDTRDESLYQNGHIAGAHNVQSSDLFNFMKSVNVQASEKIVIVSAAGQASAYYTCILRLLGYKNVFSLNFGMASWHSRFSSIWNNALYTEMNNFNNDQPPKNPLSRLPEITFTNEGASIREKIEARAKHLFKIGFKEIPENISQADIEEPAVAYESVLTNLGRNKFYLMCYSQADLYFAIGLFNPFSPKGHPPGAVLYGSNSELKSGKFLQTVPPDKPVVLYCYTGQMSAEAAAYLRMLGYDAHTILFGANAMLYSRMQWDDALKRYAFSSLQIGNYPYVNEDD